MIVRGMVQEGREVTIMLRRGLLLCFVVVAEHVESCTRKQNTTQVSFRPEKNKMGVHHQDSNPRPSSSALMKYKKRVSPATPVRERLTGGGDEA